MIKQRTIMLAAGLLLLATSAFAIKANPRPVIVKQPDGTQLTIRIHGDENRHYISTIDGYRIQRDKDGIFKYVTLNTLTQKPVLSQQRVTELADRTPQELAFVRNIDKNVSLLPAATSFKKEPAMTLSPWVLNPSAGGNGLKRSKSNRAGAEKNESEYLCVLVNFKDCRMKFNRENFDNFLNQSNYDGWGSVKDYLRDNSNGRFVPNFTTVGIYTLSQPQSFYAGNDDNSVDANSREMVIEAVRMAKEDHPEIDFSQFDNDGDGYMDNVYIIYAGYSEASTGNANDMWPHSWYLADDEMKVDGIIVKNYSCSQELVGAPGMPVNPSMDGIGTFTHEFGHILGLKDMYDTDDYYNGYGLGPGDYSLYASGSYNNDSRTPAALWAFERLQMGWMDIGKDIVQLNTGEDVRQENSATSFTARYIDCTPDLSTPESYEWFILENRQQTGWDTFIPNHGMIIYHYDYTAQSRKDCWDVNGPNNNARHRCLYLKCADNIDDENSRNGDTYPGLSGNTSFTDTSRPNALNWSGIATNVPITNIREENGIIYYQAAGGSTEWNVVNTMTPSMLHDVEVTMNAKVENSVSDISEAGFCWAEGRVCPTLDNEHATVQSVAPNTVFSYNARNLKAGTLYTYCAYMKLADGKVIYGSPMEFKTEYETAKAPYVQDFKTWEAGVPDGWLIVDRNSDGTTWVNDKNSGSICYQFDYWNNADDWLISKRRYHVPENGAIYFERGVNEENYIEALEVYISTTTSDIDQFYLHKRFSIADNFGFKVWDEVDLSQYAGKDIYIAFRCCSERMQGLLRIWTVRLEQKLGTPEVTYFGRGENDDQIKIAWTPVDNASKYYLFFGKVTSQTYKQSFFCPLDYYASYSQNVDLGTGHIFFKGNGYVELKEVPQGYEDLKFLVMPTGPVGTSFLDVEGTTDGKTWMPVCPRVTVSKYDPNGVECDFSSYVAGRGYTKFRFKFTDGGRLAHVRYLTLSYYDGFAWDQLAAGSVEGTERLVNAVTPGEFNTGKYVTWVAAGNEANLFFDESNYRFYTVSEQAKGVNAIDNVVSNTTSNGQIYNISGQRVYVPSKGLYIQNGKKMIIK